MVVSISTKGVCGCVVTLLTNQLTEERFNKQRFKANLDISWIKNVAAGRRHNMKMNNVVVSISTKGVCGHPADQPVATGKI